MSGIPSIQRATVSFYAQNEVMPSKAADAASHFEALLIASMLKASHDSGSSWLGTGDDAAGQSAIDFAEEHLSRALASQGGLGIASMVIAGLAIQNRPYATANGAGAGPAATTVDNSTSGR